MNETQDWLVIISILIISMSIFFLIGYIMGYGTRKAGK